MLPIDEHAKSGAWVYCTNRARLEFQKVRWQSGVWVHASGFGAAPADAYTHYLPVSYVENAGAMRADLVGWDATYPGVDDTVNILAATEWPVKEG